MTEFDFDLVAFGPHPDDVEICCGGFLSLAAGRGQKVAVVDLTRGELGSRGSAELRQEEAKCAAHIMKISHRENLGLIDGGINPHDQAGADSQVARVVKSLRSLKPELVLIPPVQARHPDHIAAGELLTRAVFLAGLARFMPELGAAHTPLQVLVYQMRYQLAPSFIVDISEVQALKMEAIRAYGSQVLPGEPDESQTLVSSPLSLSAVTARDQYFGAMIGARFGEAYSTGHALRVEDPLTFFRNNPVNGALVFPEAHG